MNSEHTGKPSAVDLERLKALPDEAVVADEDEPYDPNDPEAVDSFWKNAVVIRGGGPKAVREALVKRKEEESVRPV